MFALIQNSEVVQIATEEFPVHSALTWVDVSSVSPTPSPLWTYSGGVFSAPTVPVAPTLTLSQQASAALSSGLEIALSGSIALTATAFPVDPVTTGKVGAVITTLAATGAFPGGATSYPMKDAAGAWHSFTEAQYKAVAGAIADYVGTLDLIADGNPLSATTLPSSSVSLTV